MKKNFVRGAVVAAALGLSSVAQAIPLYFDFTGTVNGVSGSTFPSPHQAWTGQVFSAGFVLETDRLLPTAPGSNPLSQTFVDWSNPGPNASHAHVTIGGEAMPFPSQTYQYTSLGFNDACSPAPPACTPQWAEGFNLYAFTSDLPFDYSGVTGTFHSSSLIFGSFLPPIGGTPAFDYFDVLAGVDPMMSMTLPLYNLFAIYSVSEFACNNGSCVESSNEQAGFNITGVTRVVGSTSVPEPGTLGLLGVALAGMFFLRRRVPVRSGPFC